MLDAEHLEALTAAARQLDEAYGMAREYLWLMDETPVDEPWLRALGAKDNDAESHRELYIEVPIVGSISHLRFRFDSFAPGIISAWSLLPPVGTARIWLPTFRPSDDPTVSAVSRGHVRRLLFGLGLNPREFLDNRASAQPAHK